LFDCSPAVIKLWPWERQTRQRSLEALCAFSEVQTLGMANKKRKLTPKTVLKLPDLEQSKSAVLNSLTSRSSQRSYDHAINL
jgi:hypothetical protein